MDEDSFPHASFWTQSYLFSMRKLGLQNSLPWDVVLECARSIQDGALWDATAPEVAKSRGKELLGFLDLNWKTYFPELAPKEKSTAKSFFSKVNSALFEDPEKKRIKKELQKKRIEILLNLKWIPVHTSPPNPILSWRDEFETSFVSSPAQVTLKENMWSSSFSKRIFDGEIKSTQLVNLFGWSDRTSFTDLSLQLRSFGEHFDTTQEKVYMINEKSSLTKQIVCETLSTELPRIYHLLNKAQLDYDINVMRSILNGKKWLWMGDSFVSSDYVAFTSSINAPPYLYTVPPDIASFKNLLSIFGVRHTFGSSDFCQVLQRMSKEDGKAAKRKIEIAVNLVQSLSDDIMKLQQMDIYAPSNEGAFQNASTLIYDDAPWISKTLQSKDFTFIHQKISNTVADKIGAKSLRRLLVQDTTDTINFGEGVVHESFGQSEALTRRLKNIVEMYPEGPQQLSELVQNADDAKASIVRLIINKKSYGTKSLLGQKLSSWQGPSLMVYNDSTFSQSDFQNLARIGQNTTCGEN